MGFELGRALLTSDAVTQEALAEALFVSATQAVALPRALLSTGAIERGALEAELAQTDAPVQRVVVPVASLVERLPPGLCETLLAVPVRRDPITGTVDVAVVDARDAHAAEEISYWLDAPVRIVRSSLAAIDAALEKIRATRARASAAPPAQNPIWVPPPETIRERRATPSYGTPARALEHGPHDRPPSSGPPPSSSAHANIPIPLTRKTLPDHELSVVSAPSASAPLDTPREAFPPFPDVGPVLTSLRSAESREAVLHALLDGVHAVARRVGLFAIRNGAFVGWDCTPELCEPEAIRSIQVPIERPSILSLALSGGKEARLGLMPWTEAHAPFFAVFEPPAGEVAVVPVFVRDRPVLVVLADELGDTMSATHCMDLLANAAGQALTRVLLARARTGPPSA